MSGLKIAVIPDTQAKPGVDLSYMSWIGSWIANQRPDVIVHLGDAFDFPSLSSYDKGTKKFEGRRLKADIEAGKESMELLFEPIQKLQANQRRFRKKVYNPRKVFCLGNHEERLIRLANNAPELSGFVGYEALALDDYGWEVYDYLKPVKIQGINFVHYLANPFSGRPYGGSALSQLKHVKESFVVGHKQTLDIAIQPSLSGRMVMGVIAGAAYPHDEDYKGYQGNFHYRGVLMFDDAKDGYGDLSCMSLKRMEEIYG